MSEDADHKVATFTVSTARLAPGHDWRTKEEVAQRERDSRKIWVDIPDDNRKAILVLLRDALLRMIEEPETWVPSSMEPKTGNRLDIFISVSLSDVDDEVLRRRVEAEEQIAEATEDLVKLKGELTVEAT